MSLENIPVSSVMVRDVKTVSEKDSLQKACMVMSYNKIGSVIIVTGNDGSYTTPVGILTESDVVRHIARDPSLSQASVRPVMSHPLITVSPTSSLKEALHTIVSRNIRRLPVIENGKLVGIVTDKDIYRMIARNESLIASLISDEMLLKHVEELEQPWVYKLGEILRKRLGADSGTGKIPR